jgi:hypothetical protein
MKVESFKIKGWKKKETGLLVSENNEWILVKHIPVDYMIDGYKLYQKKFIKKRETNSKEDKIARVLSLKNIEDTKPNNFEFGEVYDILKWSESNYGLFEFQDMDEKELFYGKINQIKNNKFIINMILADGKIEENYDYEFSINKIRSITFESEYFESIRLLMLDELDNSKSLTLKS